MYQILVLDNDYSLMAWLDQWLKLKYRLALNALAPATVDLAANDSRITDCAQGRRLHIARDGQPVWGGLLQGEAWGVNRWSESAYGLDAQSYECYLEYRTIERGADDDYWRASGAADDVAKRLVRSQCGSLAAEERRYIDLTVQADAGQCANVTKLWVGGTVLEHLQRLGSERAFWWRMVPGTSGVQFATAYPWWGTDRRKGHGADEDELVFAFDRANVSQMNYRRDLSEHYNSIYMAGAGEGRDQLMELVLDDELVTAWGRREMWVAATNYVSAQGLRGEGARVLARQKPVEVMGITPMTGVLSPANLGDLCTVFDRRYGREFRFDALIVAMDFEVGADGVEWVRPELVAV